MPKAVAAIKENAAIVTLELCFNRRNEHPARIKAMRNIAPVFFVAIRIVAVAVPTIAKDALLWFMDDAPRVTAAANSPVIQSSAYPASVPWFSRSGIVAAQYVIRHANDELPETSYV